jgi:hypothetical protein
MVFWVFLAASLLITLAGLRHRLWWFLAIAFALSLPVGLVGQEPYGALEVVSALQLAMAVALRWRVGIAGWFATLLTAVAVWFVGTASIYALDWPAGVFIVLLFGLVLGVVALIWQRPPWAVNRPG